MRTLGPQERCSYVAPFPAGCILGNKTARPARISCRFANIPMLHFYPMKLVTSGVATVIRRNLTTSSNEKVFVFSPSSNFSMSC